MLKRLALALALVWSAPALADGGRILSESDTGMIFGDLDCEITEHSAKAPVLHEGDWGYLYAYVVVETTCVTADGLEWRQTGSDDVWFPTVTWDRFTQSWKQDGVTVATRRDFRTVELNPDLDYVVWTSEEDSQVALKVHVKTRASFP